MPRLFYTTGPCNPVNHCMLPPEELLIGAHLPRYVEIKLYWVLHAPRQTGKTIFLQSWMRELNSSGQGDRLLRERGTMPGIPPGPRTPCRRSARPSSRMLVRSKDGVPLNPGSHFNIKEDSITLSSFTGTMS